MKYLYNYYTVEIPNDAVSNKQEACELAMLLAQERSRIHRTPATWISKVVKETAYSYICSVCRKANK